jgi:hypothetical protein
MVQDRIYPTAEVSIAAALVPARERSFEAILNEIVGALSVAAQQRVGISAQPGNVRFEEFGRVSSSGPRQRGAAIHGAASNSKPDCGIA